jgi:signal transduction histidine kinase
MPKTHAYIAEDRHFLLSTSSPSRAQKSLALAVVLGIALVFGLIIAGPLGGVRPGRIDAFVPAYATSIFVCDAITALLLYGQFSIVRSRALLVIASGYLFAAMVAIAWALAFPGLLGPTFRVGGMQSTSYLFFFRHTGFCLFLIAYALSKHGGTKRLTEGAPRALIASSIGLTTAVVLAGSCLFIYGDAQLPRLILDTTHFSPLQIYVAAPLAFLVSFAALAVLWVRRRTVLDLWLSVIAFLFAMEIPLNFFPLPERFSIGWYSVRTLAVVSSSIVLIVLLHEIETLYAALLEAVFAHRREREARLITGDAVAASVAHEVRQPLTAMVTAADAGLRFLERSSPNLDKAKEAFNRIVADGHRADEVVESIRATFRNEPQDRVPLDLNDLIREVLAFGRADLQEHGILVRAELDGQLPAIRGSRVQLQQVLLNLIMNAVDSMAAKDAPRILSVRSEPYRGDHVLVSVADTGTGISVQDADRIFNPLFTTKTGGMGMGLAICRSIIVAHEGRLWFVPNIPRGAVFQFTLESSTPAATSA